MKKKIIIVSNRLPFSIRKQDDHFDVFPSSGGLVSAIQSLTAKTKITWIGAADFKSEDWEEFKKEEHELDFDIVPVFLDKVVEDLYYTGFSNTLIWPLFHYFPSYAEYDESFFKAYKTVNELFAEDIRAVAKDEDLVWIHDYHLMLVPGLLMQGEKKIHSSFFLHIPFPSFEIVKLIPEEWRTEILKSLLAADVAGFQTLDYCNHFKSALSYFLGVECINNCVNQDGHVTLVKDYPISIDYQKFNSAYNNEDVIKERTLVKKKYENVKMIFSLDRLDYSKGVMNRLQAYEQLLENQAEIKEKVVFVINVIPSRETISQYAERKKLIEENVSRINGLYSTLQWEPIIYRYQHLNFTQLMAYYTSCDVALVTPLRDGMNLVAKEFAASRKDLRGSLILSEFAGAASELTGALLVNPNDIHLMQEAMMQAVSLPESEQQQRMKAMQEVIQKNDVNKWMGSFLEDASAKTRQEEITVNIMSYYDRQQISNHYRKAARRLILLDYDGTLIPFYNKPEEAVPGELVKELIAKLSKDPKNSVMVISGRDSKTLENWFENSNIGIVAEHGMMYRPSKEAEWTFPPDINLSWKEGVRNYLTKYIDQYPGSFIEEKLYSVAWHYRTVENIDEDLIRTVFSKELISLNIHNDFQILHGNKVIEIKSAHTNKGQFLTHFLSKEKYDFVLGVGDDITDEDMFSVLKGKNQYTIKVGPGKTEARYNVVGVNNVLLFLEQLSGSSQLVKR
ncbi:MAG: bifunctional alpha,alpha-trehalose-phosphate synthase (UDP-forming)/trehalose-phosphatase [Bacteroidetes bacterium]|nr:bifunctional alpha,alpha-trehalose-phosphate synthase (UDP-forming)/trehalose-phosphatase [Bacteroidota bacterium]